MKIYLQSKFNVYWVPIFIFLIALTLRLWHYAEFSLSNDELSALSRIYPDSVLKTIDLGVRPDGHPAGVQVLLHYLVLFFNNSAEVIRLPFVFLGSISVLLLYILAKRWFGVSTAILASSALCFLEFPILYSQIARPYASGLFLALLLALAFDTLIFKSNSKKQEIVKAFFFGLVIAANLYNHYFSGLFAFLIGVSGFVFVRKKQLLNYLIGLTFASLLFLPHLEISFSIAKNVGGIGEWLAKPKAFWLVNHFLYIFNNSIWLSSLVIITTIGSAAYFKIDKSKNKFRILSFSLFIIPFLIGFIYSIFINPILQNSVLLFSMPFLLLFLFSFINQNKIKKEIVLLVAFAVFGSSFLTSNYYNKSHFDDFKSSAKQIESWKNKSTSSILFLENINNPWYLTYYLQKKIDFKIHNTKSLDDLKQLQSVLNSDSSQQCIYLKTGVSNELAIEMIQAHFPHLKQRIEYGDYSALYYFDKNKVLCKEGRFVHLNSSNFSDLVSKNDSSQNSIAKEYFLEYNWLSFDNMNLEYTIEFEFSSSVEQCNAIFVLRKLDKNNNETSWLGIPFSVFENSNGRGKFVVNRRFTKLKKGESIHSFIWNKSKEKLTIKNVNLVLRKLKDE